MTLLFSSWQASRCRRVLYAGSGSIPSIGIERSLPNDPRYTPKISRATSEHSRGHEHSIDEFPILVAGKAGGALRGGVHYRSGSSENISNALLTVLRATGDTRPSFGADAGVTSTVIAPPLT